jgi:DNA polymerase
MWGPLCIENQCIKLPNGLNLRYDTLERTSDGWTVKVREGRVKMYGAKLVENVVQALARVIFSEALLRLPDYKLVMMSHDEAVFVIPDAEIPEIQLATILESFRTAPAWAPDLPLDAEGHLDVVYSK